MARVSKGRRQAYDNIAVGSVITTKERVIAGATSVFPHTSVGNTEKIAVGVSYGEERVIAGAALPEGERLGG